MTVQTKNKKITKKNKFNRGHPQTVGERGQRTHLVHGALRRLPRGERNERVPSVRARHGVHHEPQVPDGPTALEQRYQFVLVHVLGYLPAEHLAAGAGRAALPPGRRTPIFTLTCKFT